jgi:hypothetical protein
VSVCEEVYEVKIAKEENQETRPQDAIVCEDPYEEKPTAKGSMCEQEEETKKEERVEEGHMMKARERKVSFAGDCGSEGDR